MTNTSVPMHEVVSSNISFIGYQEDTKSLYVTFKKGQTYKYNNVSEEVFKEFLNAPSVGSYYKSNIIGKYISEKING